MIPAEVDYLRHQISSHVMLFFDPRAKALLDSGIIRFLPYEECASSTGNVIVIPFDIPIPKNPQNVYTVPFNDTRLTLWNKIPSPSGEVWEGIPSETMPLWYRNKSGTLMPAWNLFGNVFQLLSFGEEKDSPQKDLHGRSAAAHSPRLPCDLLEVPAFNEAVAVLVAASAGLQSGHRPLFDLEGLLRPPVVVLSHDCDILLGNRRWTQWMRARGVLGPMKRFRLPKAGNIWWIIRNLATPRRFHFDNATGMMDLERTFGYKSAFYLLNGSGGQFGAGGSFAIVQELLERIPSGWDIGIHYNYDTFLNEERFKAQLGQLQSVIGTKIVIGRAHYLRFDPEESFRFLLQFGIRIDESSGYADRIGYRNGIAGCFQAFDTAAKRPLDIWEVPLTIMDAVLVGQYGNDSTRVFHDMLYHVSRLGGALTVLFHPGQFFNPEHKPMLGVYHQMLIHSRQMGAISESARSMVERVRQISCL